MRVASLHTYPIKSCYRVDADVADVEPWGLAGDRRWMITDPGGKVLTQRELATIGRIRPRYTEQGLRLRADGAPDLTLPTTAGELSPVRVSKSEVLATLAGPEADAWVSKVIEADARLVHLDDPTRRGVDPDHGRPDDRVSFADGYPVLLANTASLDALNAWLAVDGAEPITMTRFRPNIVLTGAGAWAEDGWIGRRLRIGGVTFRAVKPCDRCVFTTIDPETGVKGTQPLRILAKYRRFPDGLLFAVNLIPDGVGRIAVGDPASVLD